MNEDIQAEFQPLPASMLEPMQTRRAELHALVARQFPGDALSHTAADFELLQRIVDAGILTAEDIAGWEAMGIAFGDGADEAIDVAHMARWLQGFIEEKAHEYQ